MPKISKKRAVEIINSISQRYPDLRQSSKTITFAMLYQGTHYTLEKNTDMSEEEAKDVEKRYHDMYKVSDAWVADKLRQACSDGYVTCAFGLRVRTPILAQTLLGTKSTPSAAKAESRTAGNALGQSYCQLNMRAANEFMSRVRASEYSERISLCALIHDACYVEMADEVGVVQWVNENLIECMEWQGLPEIKHPIVKLSASLELFHNGWNRPIVIPNHASKNEIISLVNQGIRKLDTK